MKRRLPGHTFGYLIAGIPALAGIPVFTAVLVQAGAGINPAFSWATTWCLLLATGGIILSSMLRYYRPSQGSEWITLVWVLIMTLFSMSAGPLAMAFTGDEQLGLILSKSLWLRWFIAILFLGSVALISWVRKQARDDRRSREWLTEADKLARDAELHSLRQQLQPHFLFNSLNSIYALIGSDPPKARRMIQQLGDFLRGTLRRDTRQLISFHDELEHIRLYLAIEMVRFGHRLNIAWDLADDIEEGMVPPMILQPLVENAIKFGLYGQQHDVTIGIKAWKDQHQLNITVTNPRNAATDAAAGGTGFGLNSVRRRMFLLYSANDLVQTTVTSEIFSVTLRIPQVS